MEILNGIAFKPQPTARKLLFCTLLVLSIAVLVLVLVLEAIEFSNLANWSPSSANRRDQRSASTQFKQPPSTSTTKSHRKHDLTDLIEPLQSLIHQILTSPDLRRGHLGISTVPPLGSRLDRREVLMIPIAVPKEKTTLHPGSLTQPNRMVAEKLSAPTHKRYLLVQHRYGQPRPYPILVLGHEVLNQLGKKCHRIHPLDQRVLKVSPR